MLALSPQWCDGPTLPSALTSRKRAPFQPPGASFLSPPSLHSHCSPNLIGMDCRNKTNHFTNPKQILKLTLDEMGVLDTTDVVISNHRDMHTEDETIKGPKQHFLCILTENPPLKGDRWQLVYKVQNATFTLLKYKLHELLPMNLICHEI